MSETAHNEPSGSLHCYPSLVRAIEDVEKHRHLMGYLRFQVFGSGFWQVVLFDRVCLHGQSGEESAVFQWRDDVLAGGKIYRCDSPDMPDETKPGKIRHCWVCGEDMGFIENRYHDRSDTCGKRECDREARDTHEAERQEAHEELDRSFGW